MAVAQRAVDDQQAQRRAGAVSRVHLQRVQGIIGRAEEAVGSRSAQIEVAGHHGGRIQVLADRQRQPVQHLIRAAVVGRQRAHRRHLRRHQVRHVHLQKVLCLRARARRGQAAAVQLDQGAERGTLLGVAVPLAVGVQVGPIITIRLTRGPVGIT